MKILWSALLHRATIMMLMIILPTLQNRGIGLVLLINDPSCNYCLPYSLFEVAMIMLPNICIQGVCV